MKRALLSILMLGTIACQANEPKPTDWKTQANAAGLDPAAVAQLERDGILVTDAAYKQIFNAYTSGKPNPVFITSDSLLHAFHVLYEESVFRLELENARRLPPFLHAVIEGLGAAEEIEITCAPELERAAKERAKLVLGVALRLLDAEFRLGDPRLDALIAEEVARIESAQGQRMPEWLGTPSPSFMGIDYNRYKPRGFYAKRENLSRYFRALSWLHSIPFRISCDEELHSILIIGNAVDEWDIETPINYERFIGPADNLNLFDARIDTYSSRVELPSADFEKYRTQLIELARATGKGQINDLEPSFRVLSAHQTPSALLFARTQTPSRSLPSGLEVAAALDSHFAAALLDPKTRATTRAMKPNFRHHGAPVSGALRPRNSSMHAIYLHVLHALLNDPEPDAPAFMKRDAWKIKGLNAALASWSQTRHT